MRDGLFREDLYYRIACVTLTVPPLRERSGDIGPIARRLLGDVAPALGRPQDLGHHAAVAIAVRDMQGMNGQGGVQQGFQYRLAPVDR